MSVTDDLLKNNERYAASFAKGDLAMPPAKRVAVPARMDARLDARKILGSKKAMLTSFETPAVSPPTMPSGRW